MSSRAITRANRKGNGTQVSASQLSNNSSGGGDARGGSHKLSRKENKLVEADARGTEATMGNQEQRIAQLEEQLKAAMGAIQQMAGLEQLVQLVGLR